MVTKTELVQQVAGRTGSRATAVVAVDAVLAEVTAALSAGDRVVLTGFGTFEPVTRPSRVGRNPRTGATLAIPESTSVRFRPGATLRAALIGVAAGTGRVRGGGEADPEPTTEPLTSHGRAKGKVKQSVAKTTPAAGKAKHSKGKDKGKAVAPMSAKAAASGSAAGKAKHSTKPKHAAKPKKRAK